MGGIGSGRYGWQPTMENTKRIEIKLLKKQGKLDCEHTGRLSWTHNGRDSGSIGYQMFKDKMVLNYKSREREYAEWKEVSQTILFEETPCNYGGTRKWFTCPRCCSRVGVLVGPQTYFYCRKCYRLPYRSTLETPADRLLTKKHELGKKIFEHYKNGDGWMKKKGMHQKTFDRKLKEYRLLERQASTRHEKHIRILFESKS